MATVTSTDPETVADLLEQLHVPPERILLRPPPGEATEEDLLKSRRMCELIDGVLVEKAMGMYESRLAFVLGWFLESFLLKNKLGVAFGDGALMRVDKAQVRIPDISFYSWSKFPDQLLPRVQILNFVPELAIEILSPTNTKKEMERKRREYFEGGAELVWEVHPEKQIVDVFTAPEEKTTIAADGVLDGGTVLPGFTLSVKELFDQAGKRA
jgi:Uma2 family endonuclease